MRLANLQMTGAPLIPIPSLPIIMTFLFPPDLFRYPMLPRFMGRYLWLPRTGPQAAKRIPIIQNILLIDRLPAKGRGDSFCPTPPKRTAARARNRDANS